MYFFGIAIFDMVIDLQSFLLEFLVLIVGAEYGNSSCFTKTSWKISSSSNNLVTILGIYIQTNADLYRLLKFDE